MTLEFRIEKGKKSDADQLLLFNTGGQWHCPTFDELLDMVRFFFENEEKNYPVPHRGAEILMNRVKIEYDKVRGVYGRVVEVKP